MLFQLFSKKYWNHIVYTVAHELHTFVVDYISCNRIFKAIIGFLQNIVPYPLIFFLLPFYSLNFNTFAGTPATTALSGTSLITTAPAPMRQSSPNS